MPALAGTLAVTAQVDGEGAHAMLRHPFGESLVPSGVLTEAVHDSEGDLSAGLAPSAICNLSAAGGL
jgi:hypothetical protein